MKFRQIGILLIVGGFLTGHLLSALATRDGMYSISMSAGAADPSQMALYSARAVRFQIWGDVVALLGLVVYFYGVLTSRGGRNTSIVPG